jgi:hypothetical protein
MEFKMDLMCFQELDEIFQVKNHDLHCEKENNVDGSLVPTNLKARLPEGFHSILAKEGGVNKEQLSVGLAGMVVPEADEDFVAYLARFLGIKDKQTVSNWRQLLTSKDLCLENPEPGSCRIQVPLPRLKSEVTEPAAQLSVRENEDAASFFVRVGSWDSPRSVLEDLACDGPEDDEDAESYLRRTNCITNIGGQFLMDDDKVPQLVGRGKRKAESNQMGISKKVQYCL